MSARPVGSEHRPRRMSVIDEQLTRVGAIGVGAHANASILPNLAAAGIVLTATCARHLERAQSVATRFGAGLAFDHVEQMLDQAALDGVVVVVPPDQYAGVIRTCIRHRVPVFADKPGASDAAEAADLAA